MLGEFFALGPQQIDERLLIEGPHGRFPAVRARGLGPVNFARLGEILGDGTYDEVFAEAVAEHQEAPNGESGVLAVPATVCEGLARNSDLEYVADRWVATEELRLARWEAHDALGVREQLAELVGAREPNQTIWYWWSL